MEKKKNRKKINSLILLIILAVIFGLAGGVVGELITRVYILEETYNIPFFGEINFSNGQFSGSNLIIRDPKKVVVEQDMKIAETITSVSSSLVGIFTKKPEININNIKEFNIENYYLLNQSLGTGLVITSDGWMMTNTFRPDANPDRAISDYVIITKEKKIFELDKFIKDPITNFSFFHVKDAKDLPVRQFSEKNLIIKGMQVIALNWRQTSLVTSISDIKDDNVVLQFTDKFSKKIVLRDLIEADLASAIIFDLAGNIVGLSEKTGEIEPIYHFKSAISSLLLSKEIKRASLGVNYINLSDLVLNTKTEAEGVVNDGALIYKNNDGIDIVKNSPAEEAKLKAGDIITKVDNIQIDKNNDLGDTTQNHLAGEKINLTYIRDGVENEVEIELGEI
ncbi:MAG: S1C family serine protease, partial [Patescibacteria group bacterium]